MRQSQIFQKTSKEVNKADVSKNAQLLAKAGYINQLMAGVYSYLPLGLRVLTKIENIIRDEMNKISGQEIFMPALQPRELWDQTGRWDEAQDAMFTLKGAGDRDMALGATHEEIVTPLAAELIRSYKELPVAAYQIQTKFRKEARAKSGLLRGREFRMKDMYSFHASQQDLDQFYERSIQAYMNVYNRCGIGDRTYVTSATGGIFSKYSHEFQTVTEAGEDIIYLIPDSRLAINKELMGDAEACAELLLHHKVEDLKILKAIEVGNIFKLGTRFTTPMNACFMTKAGNNQDMIMGCYGMGVSRLMGTVVECLGDEKGLVWPEEIAPYQVHLVSLVHETVDVARCDALYQELTAQGMEVLYDDRIGVRAGAKLADSDLLGIPHRLIVSAKTLAEGSVEWKKRSAQEAKMVKMADILGVFKKHL